MIDPLSASFVDLEQAVARLATDISDQEVDEEQRRQKKMPQRSALPDFAG